MRSRISATVAVLLLAGLLAGCVRMPTSGPVVETRSKGDVASDTGIFFDPRPPQPGDSRLNIVQGFLAAMLATPIQTRTAREFLTEDASAAWNPQQGTITYGARTTPKDTDQGVSIVLSDVNRLDSRGAWRASEARAQQRLTFPMTLEDGEWRIDAVPDALIVPQSWFEDWFRRVSVYFFDPTASILEPEPVYVPRGEQLATTLTRALLLGPDPGLGQVAQTFVPSGLRVAVGVVVSDGVADIQLDGDAGQLTAKTVELMMAQFAWTLRQESAIESIRLSIGGEPVPLPGGVSSYRVDGGAEYNPAGFQASPLLYGLRGGRVVSGTPTGLDPVNGPLGVRDRGLRSIGVSMDASQVAGVGDGGTALLVGDLGSSEPGRVRTVVDDARDLLKPAWDFAGRTWLVDRTERGARVSYVQGRRVHRLWVRGITGEQVRMFLVSRDGTRLVAVLHRRVGDVLVVSRIEHGPAGDVVGATRAQRIGTDLDSALPIRAIAWRSPTTVAVLNPLTASLATVSDAPVDGSPSTQDTITATIEGRLRGLAGSPASDEPLFGIIPNGLVDLSSADRRRSTIEKGTTALTYVG